MMSKKKILKVFCMSAVLPMALMPFAHAAGNNPALKIIVSKRSRLDATSTAVSHTSDLFTVQDMVNYYDPAKNPECAWLLSRCDTLAKEYVDSKANQKLQCDIKDLKERVFQFNRNFIIKTSIVKEQTRQALCHIYQTILPHYPIYLQLQSMLKSLPSNILYYSTTTRYLVHQSDNMEPTDAYDTLLKHMNLLCTTFPELTDDFQLVKQNLLSSIHLKHFTYRISYLDLCEYLAIHGSRSTPEN